MQPVPASEREQKYLQIVVDRLKVCQDYQPKFGKGKSISLEQFRVMYQADPFYAWFGLDNPLMYAAHRAAGGITSIYRQIGIGCEHLFRQILMDELSLTEEQSRWSYTIPEQNGKDRTLSLDGRIPIDEVKDSHKRGIVSQWLHEAGQHLQVDGAIIEALNGPVFEVRQGYKSKDSKRQNADIANAASGYKAGYLPSVVLLSTQIDDDISSRYRASGLLLLYGTTVGTSIDSTYVFCREILGYDLADFFQRNSEILKKEVNSIAEILLSAE